jgi:hypothetical protein
VSTNSFPAPECLLVIEDTYILTITATSLASVQIMHAITAGGTDHPGEDGKTAAGSSNPKSSPLHGALMTSPSSASALTALCTGNTGTVQLGLAGSVLAVSAPAFLPRSLGHQDESMPFASGLIGVCTASITIVLGRQPGRLWVESSFLLRLLCL